VVECEVISQFKEKILSKLSKLPSFDFTAELVKAEKLNCDEYYDQSLLTYWIAIENVCKDLVVYEKAFLSACELWGKQKRKLTAKNQNIDINKYNLETQLFDLVFTHSKGFYEKQYRYINVAEVRRALNTFGMNNDDDKISFLLAKDVKSAPIGLTSKVTVRKIRNNVVHNAYKLKKARLLEVQPFLKYFFEVINSLAKQ